MPKKRSVIMNFSGMPASAVPLLRRAAAAAFLRETRFPAGAVSFVLVSDQEIRKLNRRYRGVNRVTDVISFRPPEPFLGDIYISRGRSRKQARGQKTPGRWNLPTW